MGCCKDPNFLQRLFGMFMFFWYWFFSFGYVCFFSMFEKNCIVLRICVTDILVGISEWFCLISTSLSVLKKARKALRALKGLVKIQALVRGYLVRKRAAATLHSMQALIRAQNSVRTQRARRSMSKENRFLSENLARKSLERYDETRSEFHSKRLPTSSYETPLNGFDESPKIVEIDTYKTKSKSRRFTSTMSEYGEELPPCHATVSSPLPTRISVPDHRNHQQQQDFDWYFNNLEECRYPTTHNTPRFNHSSSTLPPNTPSKSVCGGESTFYRPYYYSNFPNYMANTQSFKAKLRSHSAPKQRPEVKKRLSLNEMMAARNSLSSVRMQKPQSSNLQTQQEEESWNF
ncbi:hypothetical protein KIW84_046001 [Lathyrus oleraceus]|uniref:DUF4005 domain-containing protein n=1 Tax=Pisum sativum TaxID=3888 RepID=A0A9D4XM35_PEA|nr:hypothetical protein KIW84_046001 [Pisum sativum]